MKTRTILILFFSINVLATTWAQDADSLMKLVLEQNRELKVAREAYRVTLLEAGIGNTPPDPEIEFAYLYGKPSDLGKRIDFGVTQQLDFPTSYVYRSRLKEIHGSRAELQYLLTRQEVLLEARQLWLDHIYLKQSQDLLSGRLQQAETIHRHVQQQVETGELGLLESGQSDLMLASLEGEYEEILSLRENNQQALLELAGGTPLEITETGFPQPVPIIPDTLLEAYLQGPYARLYYQSLKLKEEEKNLAQSQHLPKLMAGYYSESVMNDVFRGFRVGISVPLWENANTIKKARSEIARAEATVNQVSLQLEREVRQKLRKLESLIIRTNKLEEALGKANSLSLLTAALENGEISLSEYFYSSDFYFRNQQQLLRFKHDLLVQEAELLKVYL